MLIHSLHFSGKSMHMNNSFNEADAQQLTVSGILHYFLSASKIVLK